MAAGTATGEERVIDAAVDDRGGCIVAVTARALRRQRGEVAVAVTVEARDRAMEAGQVAADAAVIEACRSEAPLRVALAAPRR